MKKAHFGFNLCMVFAAVLLTGCELPKNTAQKSPLTPMQSEDWITTEQSKKQFAAGKTAYLPLYDGFMSISTRIHLIHHAKHNIDLQYYIWEDDFVGNLMLSQLLSAADRGVKIRLLIDDQNGTQLDEKLLTLSQHPNFEIKLFNPYKFRNFRILDYAFRLKNVNHRMHNKLIVADGVVAVTGGRNISSEYFDASNHFQFTDVDIFFAGKAVRSANQSFLNFWNDNLSYEIQHIKNKKPDSSQLKKLREDFEKAVVNRNELKRRLDLAELEIKKQLEQHPIEWTQAHFVADHPDKIRGDAKDSQYIYAQMLGLMGEPKDHLELVSAYFVPTQKGTDYLVQRAEQGIDIRILTNSFLANDVALVHAFYKKHRQPLLQSGVKLWEFKPYIERSERTWYEKITGNVIPKKNKNSSSLHAKFFDIDGMVFVGSFNFDPRSAHLNTEVGLVVESEKFQDEITATLDQYLPQIAYELKLDEQGGVIWLDHQKNGTIKTFKNDPETTQFQRWMMKTVTLMPVEWMM